MSPGERTIPAAMVFPMAAEMPNQKPSTCSSRPRPGRAAATLEDASKVVDNESAQ